MSVEYAGGKKGDRFEKKKRVERVIKISYTAKKIKPLNYRKKKIMSIKTYFTMYIMLTSIYRIIRDYILFFFLFFLILKN